MPDTTVSNVDPHQPPAPRAGSTAPALRRLADLPGPRGLPLLGNLHQFDLKRLHQTMETWAQQYGPVYRVKVPTGPFLVVADPDLTARVLPAVLAAVAAELGAMPGVFDSEGATWRNQRRMVMQAFAPQAVKAYFPALVEVAPGHLTRCRRAPLSQVAA